MTKDFKTINVSAGLSNARPGNVYDEYALLYACEDKLKNYTRMVYNLTQHLQGIIETQTLDDLDQPLDAIPYDDRAVNLKVRRQDIISDVRFRNWAPDEIKLWTNICATFGKVVMPDSSTTTAKFLFPNIPTPTVADSTVSRLDILVELYSIAHKELIGRTAVTPFSKGAWLWFTLERLIYTTNGVGAITSIPYRLSMCLKGLWTVLARSYDLQKLQSYDERDSFFDRDAVKTTLAIFFDQEAIDNIKAIQPIQMSDLSRIPQYYSIADLDDTVYALGRRARCNVLADIDLLRVLNALMNVIVVNENSTRYLWDLHLMIVVVIIYYSMFKTSRTRAVKRSRSFELFFKSGGNLRVDMSAAEALFDDMQQTERNFSVRRAFIGSMPEMVLSVLSNFDGDFPNNWLYVKDIPYKSPYNIDYFKYINNEHCDKLRANTQYLIKGNKQPEPAKSFLFYDQTVTLTRDYPPLKEQNQNKQAPEPVNKNLKDKFVPLILNARREKGSKK